MLLNFTGAVQKVLYFSILLLIGYTTVWADLDANNNGYSDVWERMYGAQDLPQFEDTDGDGQNNFMEHQAGTDPLDSDSVFSFITQEPLSHQMMIGWESVPGLQYQIQRNETMMAADWINVGGLNGGDGGWLWSVVDSSAPRAFFRVGVVIKAGLMDGGAASFDSDTDKDGASDWAEWRRRTDIFDSNSRVAPPILKSGNGARLSWSSQPGKMYQIQSRESEPGGGWQDEGGARYGTGGVLSVVILQLEANPRIYSVWAYDVDSDADGLSDWEEEALGFRADLASTDHLGEGDYDAAALLLATSNIVKISAPVAIGNLTRGLDGEIEIGRVTGVDKLTVNLNVSGDAGADIDYESLPSSIELPFGVNSVKIPVKLLPTASVIQSESINVQIAETTTYGVEGNGNQTVNLIVELPINVADYGATGDGVTDDRASIQAAIEALESQPGKNTLHFPPGVYRLNSFLANSKTGAAYNRILRLGASDLAGRDIIINFENGAKIYSTVSPNRAHILECEAKFRSLSFYNADIEKDDVVLNKPLQVEPNAADGVSLVMHDLREVEMVQFINSRIMNCHGSIRTYGSGFNTRGKLKYFRLENCQLLCPWGANTVSHPDIWGGGQMVNLGPWIGVAQYIDNYFDGGSEVVSAPAKNPLDRKKDGSHFGSPLNLVFTGNTVDHMRVEAVYQLHDPFLTITSEAFDLPAEGEEVTLTVYDYPSNYVAGDKIAIRGPIGGGKTESVSLTIVGYQTFDRQLTVRNDGDNAFLLDGITFTARKPVYLQGDHAGVALIENNVVRALNEEGRRSSAGIVANAKAEIRHNYVEGFTVGVQIYGNSRTPLTPGQVGTVIENNVIYTPDASLNPGSTTYGMQSWGPDDMIRHNLIITPSSTHFMGIALRGQDTIVRDNTIIAEEIVRNSYSNSLRAVGVGLGNTSLNVRIENNTTRGFDVGVGPIGASQSIPHYVNGHRSIEDVLPIDPRGVIEE